MTPPDDREGQRHAPEEERDGERLAHDLGHRARLVDEGLAEVAADGLAEEDPELVPEGLVQPVGLGEVLLRLRRERVGAFGDGVEGASRGGVHHEESDEGHGQQGRNQPQEAIQDVSGQIPPRKWGPARSPASGNRCTKYPAPPVRSQAKRDPGRTWERGSRSRGCYSRPGWPPSPSPCSPRRRTLEVEAGTSILAAAHAAGIDITATCGGRGRCTSCRVKFAAGAPPPPTVMDELQLGDALVRDGYRLSCQCRPVDR